MTLEHIGKPSRDRHLIRYFLNGQFLRFALVGLSNFLVSFGVFQLCLLGLAPSQMKIPSSQFISYSAGILWSFLWNRHVTFASAGPVARQAARFLLLQVIFLAASTVLITVGVQRARLAPTVAWFLVMTIITVANFVLSRQWVFK